MKDSFEILSVGLSPAVQKTLIFESFRAGEVNRSQKYYTDAAGKCINTCRVLVQGGASAACLTVAGAENRAEIEALCARDGVRLIAVETAGRVRTCTTIVDEASNQCSEIVAGEPELISPEEERRFMEIFVDVISGNLKAVIISGSRLAGFSDEIIPFMVKSVKERGIMLMVDYRGKDLAASFISDKMRPDYVKINEEEFYETFGEFDTLEKGLLTVSDKYQSAFIITRGADDTIAVEGGAVFKVPSRTLDAVNPIGCGDSMTAGITQAVTEGLSLREAVEKGRDYAALNAMSIHPGWIGG